MGFPSPSVLPGFAAVVLPCPVPAPVKPDRDASWVLRQFAFSSCACATHPSISSAIAMNPTNPKPVLMPRAFTFVAEHRPIAALYQHLKPCNSREQDMRSVVHKSGRHSAFGNAQPSDGDANRIMGLWRSEREKRIERGTSNTNSGGTHKSGLACLRCHKAVIHPSTQLRRRMP